MTAIEKQRHSEFYTYVHLRADDGKVFYIGKGKGDRATSHHHRNPHWRSVVKKHGMRVEIAACWECESDAFSHERLLISCFRDMGQPLTNLTDGGEGGGTYVRSAETLLKYSKIHKGKVLSQETREKISASKRGVKTRPPSEATRKKISDAQKGVPRAYARGSNNPMHKPEAKAKLSAVHKGKFVSEETREKQSAAKRGRPWSEARRAAMKVKK